MSNQNQNAMSENQNFISDEESKSLTELSKTIKEEPFFSLSVYPMRVLTIQKNKDKHDQTYIKVTFDTGYKAKDGSKRTINRLFYMEGEYNGRPKKEEFVRFMKCGFEQNHITNETILSIVGKMVAVATRKDSDGYITYWYSDDIKKIDQMKAKYKPKVDAPKFAKDNDKEPDAGFMVPNESEPDFLGSVESDNPFL